MYIRLIKLKNFRQFIDAEINFNYANNKPISLILGGNASGKTTLVNAIKWCFWGKEDFSDKNIFNDQVKNKMQFGEKCNVEVEIIFNVYDRIYKIKRINTCQKTETEQPNNNQKLSLLYIDKSGTEYIIDDKNIKQELEKMLPSNVSELMFLTDSNYHFSKTYSNEIKFITDLCEKYSLDGKQMLEEKINKYFSMVCPERNSAINIIENKINYSLPAAQAIFLAIIFKISVRDILKFLKENYDFSIELFPLVLDSIFGCLDPYQSEKMFTILKELPEQVILLSKELCIDSNIRKQITDYINTDFNLGTIK